MSFFKVDLSSGNKSPTYVPPNGLWPQEVSLGFSPKRRSVKATVVPRGSLFRNGYYGFTLRATWLGFHFRLCTGVSPP